MAEAAARESCTRPGRIQPGTKAATIQTPYFPVKRMASSVHHVNTAEQRLISQSMEVMILRRSGHHFSWLYELCICFTVIVAVRGKAKGSVCQDILFSSMDRRTVIKVMPMCFPLFPDYIFMATSQANAIAVQFLLTNLNVQFLLIQLNDNSVIAGTALV